MRVMHEGSSRVLLCALSLFVALSTPTWDDGGECGCRWTASRQAVARAHTVEVVVGAAASAWGRMRLRGGGEISDSDASVRASCRESSSGEELQHETYHYTEVEQLRGVGRDGLGRESSASEAERQSENSRAGEPIAEQRRVVARESCVGEGDGARSAREGVKGMHATAPDEEIALCMKLDAIAQDRRGEGSKQRRVTARQRRIQQTGSLARKPMGSRRERQGATASAKAAADMQLLSVCIQLLNDTASSPLNADMSSCDGRKWYKTKEGAAFLDKQRSLNEFASRNTANRLFAQEWGCLPDELRQARKAARVLRGRLFAHLAEFDSDSTHDDDDDDGGQEDRSMRTGTAASGDTVDAKAGASEAANATKVEVYVRDVLERMRVNLDQQVKLSPFHCDAPTRALSQPDTALVTRDACQRGSVSGGGGGKDSRGASGAGGRREGALELHAALRKGIRELEAHGDADSQVLLERWVEQLEQRRASAEWESEGGVEDAEALAAAGSEDDSTASALRLVCGRAGRHPEPPSQRVSEAQTGFSPRGAAHRPL
jgi:hypothetical protein